MNRRIIAILFLTLSASFTICQARIRPKAIEKIRREVWQEWCTAQAAADTLPWPAQDSLSLAHTVRWHLPDALEAHADMDFYGGTKGDKPQGGYPLLLYLHGSGPRDMEWATGLKLCQMFDDAPSVYAIPRIPREDRYRWYPQSKQWAWEHLIRQAFTRPDIDPARIYLFGISEGGYGSQRLASFYADYLAGAGPMAGGEPLINAPAENLSHTAFSFVTGMKDFMFCRNLLTAATCHALDSLADRYPGQYLHRIRMPENMGHGVDYRITTPWLVRYSREAQPKAFRWENFEMDGVKRNSFYNLEVLDEQPDVRTCYDVDIHDNTVRICVRHVTYETTFTDPQWGIPMLFKRHLSPAPHGRLRIWLSEELVNLNRPVTVVVDAGATVPGSVVTHEQPLQLTHESVHKAMQQSCTLWGDPLRLFPAYVEVGW